jgi:pyruvate formate lyase activating enzyme
MKIGGIQKNSLVDWAGKVVSVVFTKGCNFRCGYCHNPSLVIPEFINSNEDIPESTLFFYLTNRKLWLDGVVISGGEPTIHEDLPEFIRRIRETGLAVKLDTNGTNPEMIKELVKNHLIDYIALDIKTILNFDEYRKITNCVNPAYIDMINESIQIIRKSGIRYQFRTTILPGLHTEGILDCLQNTFSKDPYLKQHYREGVTIDKIISDKKIAEHQPQ